MIKDIEKNKSNFFKSSLKFLKNIAKPRIGIIVKKDILNYSIILKILYPYLCSNEILFFIVVGLK